MHEYEKLGSFYLGRLQDAGRGLLLYDSKDLVTHAVCVGMTGSGKTGLCLGLLEEAAIDGVPAIVIDPKGDLSNLLLTFPELRPEDFLPWVNPDEARNQGLEVEAYAAKQAELWRKGLADWDQDSARIRRLRDAAAMAVYTPGSDAGIPVSILKSFAAPDTATLEDREMLRDRISGTVTSLLGLAGIQADPIQSREHVLLANILDAAWKQGRELDLPALIGQIQKPPMQRIGVLDVDTFYPPKERFGLAMALNNLLASPGFEAWLQGEPLEVDHLLHTPQGKPRICIFSIAHLSDAERMFFVSLLLNQMLSWVRAQSGTTSLRAILYMDEIFGYFPPVANPPSKRPLLALLKQARAFGLGVVLATQNPVDLDYKGLANAGTWFLGRLQTERDKARVLEGLEGASAEAGSRFDRAAMERKLASLGNRVFLMHNVHEDAPVLFQTRWTMSYLRGPLTRDQIRRLAPDDGQAAPSAAQRPAPAATVPPALPPEIPQYFVPLRGSTAQATYRPVLAGAAQMHFLDAKTGVDLLREALFLAPFTEDPVGASWDRAEEADAAASDLENAPAEGAAFAELPAAAAKVKNYAAWSKTFATWLFRGQNLALYRSPSLGETSKPGESERDFRIRLQQAAREERDRRTEELRRRYAPRKAALEERKRRVAQAVEREAQQEQAQKLQTALSVGAGLLGAFLGRKTLSVANIGRVTTAARSLTRNRKESADVERAAENVEALQQQIDELEAQFQADLAELAAKVDPAAESFETLTVRLKKTNITVQFVALAWVPE
ncbi:MAG: ATP-binding protein [Acidobacteria bacterium]|nr:ATP-binding protein [Acidobacteriota bacterium]